MKKILVTALALCSSFAFAEPVYRSSFTITNDTGLILDEVSTNTIPHILSKVIVSSITSNGLLKIYNSTYTTTGLKANISLGTVATYNFDGMVMKGIYYQITGNGNGVTIIYRD